MATQADLYEQGESAVSNLDMALSSQTVPLCYQVNDCQILPILPPSQAPVLFLHHELLHMLSVSLSLKSDYGAVGHQGSDSHHHLFIHQYVES